jgi:hypothetical protein
MAKPPTARKQARPQPVDPAEAAKAVVAFVSQDKVRRILASLVIAILAAIATAVFAFYKEDVAVRVASLFVSGPVNGEWLLASWATADPPATGYERTCEQVSLKQFQFRVIGDSRGTTRSWTLSGYYNAPHLSLSSVSSIGTTGLGGFTGRRVAEGAFAFVGEQTAVNCKGDNIQPVLLRCPAILVRADHQELIRKYGANLRDADCREIATDGAPVRVCHYDNKPQQPRTKC